MRLPSSHNNNYQENLSHAIQETFKKYNVHLEMCLGDGFIMNGFLDFLKNELNASSLEFLVKIDEYSNSHNSSTFYSNGSSVNNVNSPAGLLPSIQTSTTTISTISIGSPLSPSVSSTSFTSPGRKVQRKDSLKDLTEHNSIFSQPFNNNKISRKAKAKEIIDKFLNDHSAHQVNLSSQIRDAVLRNYEKECSRGGGENDINPHLFDEARTEVSLQLKCDSFVRFLKSHSFFNLIVSKVEKEVTSKNLDAIYKFLNIYFSKIGETKKNQVSQFITNKSNRALSPASPASGSGSGSGSPLGLVSPLADLSSDDGSIDSVESITHVNHVQTMLSLHTLSPNGIETKILDNVMDIREKFTKSIAELVDDIVTEQQFDLLIELVNNESLWLKVHEDSESSCFVSENKFYHNSRGLKIYKEVGIIESSPEEVLFALTDMRILNIIDDTMSNVKFERFVKGPTYAVSYLSSKMKMAWPMSDRQFLIGTSIRDETFDSYNGYTILRRSHDCKEVPLSKGCIKGIFLGGVVIEKLSEKHTRFTASGFVDMGGKFPLSLFNKILSLRQSKGVENVKKGISKRRNMPLTEQQVNSENSFYLLDTLFYSREHKTQPNSSSSHTPSF
ncbi:predicted protein [Naegleria gruberi]|uniref:Predicted protein n=1 Tax=Naegleria gruberi TaxID=5762 RepID=D2VTQ0_NAEGR|nr:uncharacterized protein NAEGRDRAFT_52170 [Naegleria gruberi]EFC39692.1 predicted protein [Naegleria gruberi]|eukprot:XP_002672436.1 predicted protein [Naegleria gruberi strain NEG-M]